MYSRLYTIPGNRRKGHRSRSRLGRSGEPSTRALGYRDELPEWREPLLLRLKVIREMLESDDLQAVKCGLREFAELDRSALATLKLELEHVQKVWEILAVERVAKLQLADDRPDGRGVSPEESNRVIAEMLAEARAGKQTEASSAEAPGVNEPMSNVA